MHHRNRGIWWDGLNQLLIKDMVKKLHLNKLWDVITHPLAPFTNMV